MSRIGISAILLVTLTACTESIYFHATPPGAKVIVNNTEVGVAPFVFKAPSKSLRSTQYRYRIELDGYRSAEGSLPVRVSPGRIVGSIFTFGILYGFRGVRVFRDDQIETTLHPLEAASADAEGAAPGTPHSRKVFFTTAPLDSLSPDSYVFIKDLDVASQFYGGSNRVLEEMAVEARKIGADAVFEVQTHQSVGA